MLEVAALEGRRGRGLVSNCALLGLVLGQSLLVIKPHSTGVLPLGLNTKSASETSLIIWKSTGNSGENRGNTVRLESWEHGQESSTSFRERKSSARLRGCRASSQAQQQAKLGSKVRGQTQNLNTPAKIRDRVRNCISSNSGKPLHALRFLSRSYPRCRQENASLHM